MKSIFFFDSSVKPAEFENLTFRVWETGRRGGVDFGPYIDVFQ